MKTGLKERRRAKRLPILETFSLFCSIPKLGPVRQAVLDVSELGMGVVVADDTPTSEHLPADKVIEVAIFLNPSLSIPLKARVVRTVQIEGVGTQVGLEFSDRKSPGFRAVSAFLKMLDEIGAAASIGKTSKP